MTATNHAITGAIIGLVVGQPLIALPAAFLSHFVCDAIPHFGPAANISNNNWLKSKTFKTMLRTDAVCCILLVAVIADRHPVHWLLACICAFLATSPDLFWINGFMKANKNKKWNPNLYSKFAYTIQWFEKPTGALVELTWLVYGIFIISIFIR
jgi:hypothetical protein